ncbi:hypothetical protein BKA65DRAFT_12760 [Rhexocercosporidium sp. MPI-PUGE-AT-0058]|nr:hypothetical protein BKA65DRAFT_12760 [Rhexocercosporidium sp. MPI-PUGE-AT-0058]
MVSFVVTYRKPWNSIPSTTMERLKPPFISPTVTQRLNSRAPAFVPANTLRATAVDFSPPFRKEFYGGIVEFGPGAAVISIKLATDCSIIQIKGLRETTPGAIPTVLDMLGFKTSTSSIQINESSTGAIATVKFDDPNTARLVVEKSATTLRDSKVTICQIVALANPSEWVQLGGVKCSWEKPSRMAFVEYRINSPRVDELPATLSQTLTPSGRRLRCVALPKSDYETSRALQSFCLNNLDTDADIKWVKDALVHAGFEYPKKVKVRQVGEDGAADDDGCLNIIRSLLENIGLVESFSSGDSPDGAKKLLTANFHIPADAQKAVAGIKYNHPDVFPASKKLTVERLVSMKVNIPNKIASALDGHLQTLRVEVQKNGRDTMKIMKDDEKPHTVIRFSNVGDDALAAVAKTKARVEKLLAGTVVTDSGVPIWHSWFTSAKDAGGYLHWVSSTCNVYVRRSISKGHLILYGGAYGDRHRACMILKAKVQELKDETAYTIRPVGGMSIAEILDFLEPVFGEKVRLIPSDGSAKIKLRGSIVDVRKARRMVMPATQSKVGDCIICYDTPEDGNTIHVGCGHIYCRECFIYLFKDPNEYFLPLTCSGITKDEQECTRLIDLEILREHFSFAEFESIIKLSIDVHLRTHPNDFGFCPTPDCEVIFRRTAVENRNPPLTTCTGCLKTYDTSCGRYHPGQTCKEHIDEVDGTDAFAQYCADVGMKNCPGCRVPAIKTDGCNHILCTRCHIHYCWVCLMALPSQGQTYDHLTVVHGGIGIPDIIPHEFLPPNQGGDADGWANVRAAADALENDQVFGPLRQVVRDFRLEHLVQRNQAPVANMGQPQENFARGDLIADRIRELEGPWDEV